ncbi:hypothetical protein GGS24DRAFT_484317 [Hypoxylon argillaceum]|nr:hypothetical protein GGS24DRAFT_484317 [Hypoxylon argillaceum]
MLDLLVLSVLLATVWVTAAWAASATMATMATMAMMAMAVTDVLADAAVPAPESRSNGVRATAFPTARMNLNRTRPSLT